MLSDAAKRRLVVALTSEAVGAEVADAIDSGGNGTALDTSYDNSISALNATNVQDALDEIVLGGGGPGITVHSQLQGLDQDDHTQYLNETRGDARYYTQSQIDSLLTGQEKALAFFDDNGNLASSGILLDTDVNGFNHYSSLIPDGQSAGIAWNRHNADFRPAQNSPNESWNVTSNYINVDPDSTGFQIGTGGNFLTFLNLFINHGGTSNIGNVSYLRTGAEIGNGVDAIDFGGLSLFTGYASINDNVNIIGGLQGYGFQINIDANATINQYTNAFYDNANYTAIPEQGAGYSSFTAQPNLTAIPNNSNYTGLDIRPNIDQFIGNASFNAIAIAPQLGTFDSGNFNAIMINPIIDDIDNAIGLYVDMNSVSASNSKWAAFFEGDVNITGSLSFGGALSIGRLNAFGELEVTDGGGNPTSVNGLISQITAPANTTIANIDTIGINTAALMQINENAVLTSGAFGLGLSALAIPAVIETHTGSSVDFVTAAAYALNLSSTSTGGTIDHVALTRALIIPNGITTINSLYGFHFELPFGDVSANQWGLYIEDAEQNYIETALKVGGSDTATNSSVGIEIGSTTKSFLNARMSTVERDALTPVDGMQVYNTTTSKLEVYSSGNWVQLH